ncbi:MAG: ABC transporter permease [Pyrinomonadaceae bacterium]
MNKGLRKSLAIGSRAQIAGGTILAAFYLVAIFAGFLAPYDYREQTRLEPSAPPSTIRMRDASGDWRRPYIYARRLVDARNLVYEDDLSARYPIELFVNGRLFGIASADGEASPAKLRLLGTDNLGRDRLSRLLHAIRFSLFVSPIGTVLACLIGIIFGSISGYATKSIDAVMMGIADTVISLPTLILILAARAAFPLELPPITAAILLIMIFALTGWAEMARLTRGLVASTRKREYIVAARAIGLGEARILFRHILPNIASPLLVQATLLLPAFLLAEVALSFLGVGLQEPEPSLGNMLSGASDLTLLRNAPILLLSPAIAIFLFVLGVRLIGGRSDRSAHRGW